MLYASLVCTKYMYTMQAIMLYSLVCMLHLFIVIHIMYIMHAMFDFILHLSTFSVTKVLS